MESDTPDILLRLRGVQHNILADMTREAADEIERLRADLAAAIQQRDEACQRTYNAGFVEASRIHGIEIQQLRQQRDEARREWCYMESCVRNEYGIEPADEPSIAAERGWDCFKEGGGA